MNPRKKNIKGVFIVTLALMLLTFTAGSYAADTIPFGVLTSLTGPLGTEGEPCYKTVEWTVKEINMLGGPLGKKIKISVSDTATDVERGIAGARKLISMNRSITLIGPSSSIVVAIMKFAEDSGVPIISHWSGSTRLTTSGGKYQFRTCPDDFFEGQVAARFSHDQGFKRAAVIALNDEDTLSIANAYKKNVTAMGGQIVGDVLVNPDQTTYRTATRKILASNPDVVFFAVDVDTLKIVYREMYEMGMSAKAIFAANAMQPVTMEILGAKALEGVYGETPANALGSPAYSYFEKKYVEHMNEETVSWFTPNMYDAVNIFALAIQAGGKADGKTISENVRKVANPPGVKVYSYAEALAHLLKGNEINYEGASGPCDFDEFGNVVGNSRIQQGQNGKWVDIKFYSGTELAQEVK
jgi:ABC-type branched-subunit amino acid transport system substrate-binding protein